MEKELRNQKNMKTCQVNSSKVHTNHLLLSTKGWEGLVCLPAYICLPGYICLSACRDTRISLQEMEGHMLRVLVQGQCLRGKKKVGKHI